MQPMPRTTGAGFPYNCPKHMKLHKIEDDDKPYYMPNLDVVQDMDCAEEILSKGVTCNPVFTAAFKDEPLSFKKMAESKTRVIFGVAFNFSLLVRKYFLLFVVFFQTNSYVFEGAPGINATGPEWTKLHNYLTEFGADRIIAGDFKRWDKSVLLADIMVMAFMLILNVSFAYGLYDAHSRVVMIGIATEICYCTVNYFGSYCQFFGTNPSGHNLTVIINCVVNSILLRYAFIVIARSNGDTRNDMVIVADFDKYVQLMTYGDDNIAGISPEVPWFTHNSISECLGDIGITYTDAKKQGIHRDYSNIYEEEFLKRSFRFEDDGGPDDWSSGFVRAPLNKESIVRMLMVNVSNMLSPQEQMMELMRAADRESYQHGRVYHAWLRGHIEGAIEHLNFGVFFFDRPMPSYDEYTIQMYGTKSI